MWFKKLVRGKPHLVVNDDQGALYLRRWWLLPRNRFVNVYLHHFKGSDSDRALHDHPWASFSVMLKGELREHTAADDYVGTGRTAARTVVAGMMRFRSAKFLHRLELISDEAWTVFITGPRVREWGFLMKSGTWLRHQVVEAALMNRDIDDALRRAECLENKVISDSDYRDACEELRNG